MGQRVIQGDEIGVDWKALISDIQGDVPDDTSTSSQKSRKAAEKRVLDEDDVDNVDTGTVAICYGQ